MIAVLGLEHVRDKAVGDDRNRGVSGGEKRRVNIGIELVASPSVLFLDEPTTGLDSTTALSVMEALRKVAALGVNVVCVIHQPRYVAAAATSAAGLIAPARAPQSRSV